VIRLIQTAPAVLMAALSALVIFSTRDLPYWSDYSPGPAFAPWWIGACGLVLSALLVLQVLRAGPQPLPEEAITTRRGFIRASSTFAVLVAFVVLIPIIGLVLASMAAAAVIMLVILRRAVVTSVFTMLITGAVIYGIFLWWLQVPLPKGPLGF
jgi:putative tricarboxylic transport membrane protein